jgi:hypothetical protein
VTSSFDEDLDFFLLFLTVVDGAGAGEDSSESVDASCTGLEGWVFLADTGVLAGIGDESFDATSSLLLLLFFDETSLSLSLSLEEETDCVLEYKLPLNLELAYPLFLTASSSLCACSQRRMMSFVPPFLMLE